MYRCPLVCGEQPFVLGGSHVGAKGDLVHAVESQGPQLSDQVPIVEVDEFSRKTGCQAGRHGAG